MVLPTLLLQKTSLISKSKDNEEILKRRFNQWKDRRKEKLLVKGKTIQERLFKGNVNNQSSDRKQLYLLGLWETEK